MHLHSLINAFVVRCLGSIIHVSLLDIAEMSRPKPVFVAELAGLSLKLVANPEDRFSPDVAHI